MSRPIKFRAYQKVHDLHRNPGMFTVADLVLYGKNEHGGGEVFFWEDDMKSSVYLEDVHLMQYTGLKDSKGVEIYEGDIVNFWSNGIISAVVWHNAGFILQGGHLTLADMFKSEIIGNIYENPELLEKK